MYIHIGGEYTISARYIIGIFDFDSIADSSPDTVNFIKKNEQMGLVELVSPDIPRSVIVMLDKVYISPVSPTTLRQRMEKNQNIKVQEGV